MNKTAKVNPTIFVLLIILALPFFIKEKVIVIFLGIIFVFMGIWLLPRLVHELAFFGAVYGLLEWWKYWGAPSLSLPTMPQSVFIFASAFILTWVVLRLLLVLSLFIPFLQPLIVLINGGKPL